MAISTIKVQNTSYSINADTVDGMHAKDFALTSGSYPNLSVGDSDKLGGKLAQDYSTTEHTHDIATATKAGFISAADKSKLNGIESGANKYILPIATDSILGGIKSGGDISVDKDGAVTIDISTATTEEIDNLFVEDPVAGTWLFNETLSSYPTNLDINFTSNGEKFTGFTNTNKIPEQKMVYKNAGSTLLTIAYGSITKWSNEAYRTVVIPTGLGFNTGAILSFLQANATKVGSFVGADTIVGMNALAEFKVKCDETYVYDNATTSTAGLMSAADKAKLNGIEANANNYTLPAATSTTLGGIKSGDDITVDTQGNVTVKNADTATTATKATKLSSGSWTIEASGTTLYFKYGSTTVATLTSSGIFDLK